jgi:hypothetical protein
MGVARQIAEVWCPAAIFVQHNSVEQASRVRLRLALTIGIRSALRRRERRKPMKTKTNVKAGIIAILIG